MSLLGMVRQRYSREVEQAPSWFQPGDAYRQWAARADAWGRANGLLP